MVRIVAIVFVLLFGFCGCSLTSPEANISFSNVDTQDEWTVSRHLFSDETHTNSRVQIYYPQIASSHNT